jgi:hypothetical protein
MCKTPPRVNRGLSFSLEIATTEEVRGWITKIQLQRRKLTTDTSSTIPLDSPLGII